MDSVNISSERVLLLYLPTGGGHISNCKAISARIQALFGADTLIFDPVSSKNSVKYSLLTDGYKVLSQRLPVIWSLIYRINTLRISILLSHVAAWFLARKALREVFENYQPTRVICTHHLLTSALKWHLKKTKKNIPCTVVVTDPFEPPRIWALGHQFPLFCYSHEAKKLFEKNGISSNRIQVFPLVIAEKFFQKMTPNEIQAFKRQEGFSTDKKLVLLAGGGDGLRKADKILEELCASHADFDIALICGTDQEMKKKVDPLAQKLRRTGRCIAVYGFTNQMRELINAADLVVSKAGPALLCEILACGKPNIVASFIPGQEKPNVLWLERKGVGIYRPGFIEQRQEIERLLSDPDYYALFIRHIEILGFKNGLSEIAQALME